MPDTVLGPGSPGDKANEDPHLHAAYTAVSRTRACDELEIKESRNTTHEKESCSRKRAGEGLGGRLGRQWQTGCSAQASLRRQGRDEDRGGQGRKVLGRRDSQCSGGRQAGWAQITKRLGPWQER